MNSTKPGLTAISARGSTRQIDAVVVATSVHTRRDRHGSHEREWVQACKGGPKPTSNFDHSGPVVESLLLP